MRDFIVSKGLEPFAVKKCKRSSNFDDVFNILCLATDAKSFCIIIIHDSLKRAVFCICCPTSGEDGRQPLMLTSQLFCVVAMTLVPECKA